MRNLAILVFLAIVTGCTGGSGAQSTKDPVSSSSAKPAEKKERRLAQPAPVSVDQCEKFLPPDFTIPSFFKYEKEDGVFITRVISSCMTRDGDRGFGRGTGWMAMGIPCTSGKGPIEITGKIYNPKVVAFNMSTDCPMLPRNLQTLVDSSRTNLGFDEGAKLLALNPLAVQYWEIAEFGDADVGARIQVRVQADEKMRQFWNQFKDEGRKIGVKVYGRENAWVQDDNFYMAQGELSYVAPMGFIFKVLDAKVVPKFEVKELADRCANLMPRRNCGEVF